MMWVSVTEGEGGHLLSRWLCRSCCTSMWPWGTLFGTRMPLSPTSYCCPSFCATILLCTRKPLSNTTNYKGKNLVRKKEISFCWTCSSRHASNLARFSLSSNAEETSPVRKASLYFSTPPFTAALITPSITKKVSERE